MLSKIKTGLAVGAFVALVHFTWSLFVWFGWGQPFADWVAGLHFVEPFMTVRDFDFLNAIYLVFVAAVVGYAVGAVFAAIWNWANKE